MEQAGARLCVRLSHRTSLVTTWKGLPHHKDICTQTRESGIIKVGFQAPWLVIGTEGFTADSEGRGRDLSYNGCIRTESQREGGRGFPTSGTLIASAQRVPDIQHTPLEKPASRPHFQTAHQFAGSQAHW